MKTDIYQKLKVDFNKELDEAINIMEALDAQTKGLISDRLLRAIIYLAKGNIHRLKEVIKLSQKDFRDILWQAEYDCGETLIHDFEKTFHELKMMN